MPLDVWYIYLATVLALMSTPGPSHLLMLSNSGAHGFGRSLATAAGDLTANMLQMLAAGLGLAALITTSGMALSVIKWVGVVYLIWLGLRMIRNASDNASSGGAASQTASLNGLWLQGFITSAANPKAIVFFAALFPQFISSELAFWPQFLILSATYLVLDGTFLTAYGLGASWIAKRFRGKARKWIDRTGGGFMIAAALLLSTKSIVQRT
ncbi:MAG: LysE family translocator [Pseudomonadota bacterium]